MSRRKQSKPKLLKNESDSDHSLETAMKKCKKEDKVHCKFCEEEFDDVSTLQVHTLINHSAESVRPSSSAGTSLDNLPSPEENSTSKQDSYVCQQCHSNFDSFEQFACHMRDHIKATENDRLSCKICGIIFTSPQLRTAHIVDHFLGVTAHLQCSSCPDIIFQSKNQFFQHQNDKHIEILYRCKICLQFFSTEHALENHVVSHAQTKEIYSCVFCNIPFDNKEQLAIHIQLIHDNNVPLDRVVPVISSQDVSPRESRLLKCSVCDAVCLTDNELDEHRLLYHCKVLKGERCGECYKVISSKVDFLEHSVLHNGDRTEISCIVCRQTIRDSIQLNLHGAFHMELAYASKEGEAAQPTEGKVSPSSVASDLSTSSKKNHKEDLENREVEKPKFRCVNCPKEFNSQSALQGHSHVHMKYKTFRCERCTLCFSSATRLASHQKRHLTEQNVTCQICDMSFTENDQLHKHMKEHETRLNSNRS
ncbi:hypothetical protein QR680_008494 [Steinernema hermaphroditum]|uniref:C2H2-type domain-containing protein n=1 Tax=Steinernema hermaphroditum TaxID=289476 RepID=A0AA39M848_9BILA|nr:hypothetical protein QR680_008494 [Steinernema hermaphroditum]